MLNMNLKKQWGELVLALKKTERHYALGENYAIHVEISPRFLHEDTLIARLGVFERVEERHGDLVEVDWEGVDLDQVPAKFLGRVVEIKMLVEKWNASELDELPPSTTDDFMAAQEERYRTQRHRRHRLRR
jgi:hypothetical protein